MPRSNETVALNSKDSRHDLPFSSLNSRSKSEVTILKGKKRQVKYSLEHSKHLGGGSTAFKQYTAVHTKIYNTRRANGPYKSPPSLPWPWLRPFRRRSKNSTRKRERLTTPLPLSFARGPTGPISSSTYAAPPPLGHRTKQLSSAFGGESERKSSASEGARGRSGQNAICGKVLKIHNSGGCTSVFRV